MSVQPRPPVPLPSTRPTTSVLPPTEITPSFIIGATNKSYKHQYSNIYFIRLKKLREFVERNALRSWRNLDGSPTLVPRVLEVTKSKLCYIVGTIFMDMPLKPNVMKDLSRDRSILAPPPPAKFYSPDDNVMIEDESGRIRLVGERLKSARLVTGVIIGALGMETPNGDFEVVDICSADLAPQPSSEVEETEEEEMDVDSAASDPWIGVISGLDVGSEASSDARIQMLVEYLAGEGGVVDEQVSASRISRLVIAGDSLSSISISPRGEAAPAEDRKSRRQAQDASVFSPHPIHSLSAHLLDIGRTIPIHILPGETDPSGTILPQQPLPRAMFGEVSKIPSFVCEPNPTYIRLTPGVVGAGEEEESDFSQTLPGERTLLVNSGQPLNDIFKYLPNRHNSRLSILESTLKWRHMAPTAPDTLWCHPYHTDDPFMLHETPDIYIVGGQKSFRTKMVVGGETKKEKRKIRCRVVMVPHFARTGILVLINLRSLDVRTLDFALEGMTGAGGMEMVIEEPPPSASPLPAEPESSAPQLSGSPGPM